METILELLASQTDARLVLFDKHGIGYAEPTQHDLIAFASGSIAYPHGIGVRFTDENDNDVAVHMSPREVSDYLRATCAPNGECK